MICCLVALALGSALLPVAAADARRAAVCTKKGGKTLLATRGARVFKKRDQVYACLRRKRRAFRLGTNALPYGEDQVQSLRLRGRFVAYSLVISTRRSMRVRDLSSGRVVHAAQAMVAPTHLNVITALKLRRNGSIAWMVRSDPIDVPLKPYPMPSDYLPYYEVSRSDSTGWALLDSGRDINGSFGDRSLSLRGNLLQWLKAGRVRSAPLN